MSIPTDFTWLFEAARIIAYDNGMINRTTTEDEILIEMMNRAAERNELYKMVLAERYLARLSSEDLQELCIGEASESTPEYVDKILNDLFE